MRRMIPFLLLMFGAMGADNPWAKVRELKSGTELRIYKSGAKQPMLVKMDEATDENIIVVAKNEQVSIAKDQIDRIDYRPARTGSKVVKETTVTTTDPDLSKVSAAGRPGETHGSSSSSSTSFSTAPKPDFETIYRRSATPQK